MTAVIVVVALVTFIAAVNVVVWRVTIRSVQSVDPTAYRPWHWTVLVGPFAYYPWLDRQPPVREVRVSRRLSWLRHREHWLHWVWCSRVWNVSTHSGGGQDWHPSCRCRLDWCKSVPPKAFRRAAR